MKYIIVIGMVTVLAVVSYVYYHTAQEKNALEEKFRSAVLNLKVNIEDVQYLGGDDYKIAIEFENPSKETLEVEDFSILAFVQLEKYGNWKEVPVFYYATPTEHVRWEGPIKSLGPGCLGRCHSIDVKSFFQFGFPIEPIEKKVRYIAIEIPEIQDLFKTFEGDLSIKIHYNISFNARMLGKDIERREDEISMWLRPKTNLWIQRDGM